MYADLLVKPEWHEKTQKILKRDNHRCVKCGCLGYHSSVIEFKDIQSLREILKDSYVNDIPLVDFMQKEYESSEGYIETKGRVWKVSKNNGEWYRTEVTRFWGKRLGPLSSVKQTAFLFSRGPIYEVNKGLGDCIDVRYKQYGHWRDEQLKFIDNTINVNLGDHFSNKIELACSFKFDREFTNTCTFSLSNEPFMIHFTDPCNNVCFENGTILSITYKNFCFHLHLSPWVFDNNMNRREGITGGLNIHHKYYINGRNPWEYDDEALITLCDECHKQTHKTTQIPEYVNSTEARNFLGNAVLCDRCGGSGYLPQYEHVQGGECFKCHGEGVII